MKNKGFSLLELLIVLAIIGLIASIAVPKYLNSMNKARWETSRQQLKRVAEAFDQFNLDRGYYPEFASWDEIAVPDNILIKEGYIDKIPLKDKFGTKYEGYSKSDTYLFTGHAAPGKYATRYPKYYLKEGNFLSESDYEQLMATRNETPAGDATATQTGQEGEQPQAQQPAESDTPQN